MLTTRCRAALVGVTVTAGGLLGGRRLLTELLAPAQRSTGAAEAVVALSLAALLVALVWAWLATMSVLVEAWRGHRLARQPAPALVRRLVLIACGVALVVPASRAEADDALDGLPLPDRPAGGVVVAGPVQAPPATSRPRRVVVAAGDTLWAIAARNLPPGASDAAVTARWHALHRRNAAVIGPDPHLIHPGQHLVLSPLSEGPR